MGIQGISAEAPLSSSRGMYTVFQIPDTHRPSGIRGFSNRGQGSHNLRRVVSGLKYGVMSMLLLVRVVPMSQDHSILQPDLGCQAKRPSSLPAARTRGTVCMLRLTRIGG
ncbi:hypothetical protein LIA77_01262 [Sarocladium implicatum]|nr:hypothetical protein LIA77_01262 [Sarocladium implicatum]